MFNGSLTYLASSPDENGTTAVASGRLSLTLECVQATRPCQLFEKRFCRSRVMPLYLERAELSKAITRLKFENGRPVYLLTVVVPPPAMLMVNGVGLLTLTSRERCRSLPLTY